MLSFYLFLALKNISEQTQEKMLDCVALLGVGGIHMLPMNYWTELCFLWHSRNFLVYANKNMDFMILTFWKPLCLLVRKYTIF